MSLRHQLQEVCTGGEIRKVDRNDIGSWLRLTSVDRPNLLTEAVVKDNGCLAALIYRKIESGMIENWHRQELQTKPCVNRLSLSQIRKWRLHSEEPCTTGADVGDVFGGVEDGGYVNTIQRPLFRDLPCAAVVC